MYSSFYGGYPSSLLYRSFLPSLVRHGLDPEDLHMLKAIHHKRIVYIDDYQKK